MRFSMTPPPRDEAGFRRWTEDTIRRLAALALDNQPRTDDLRFPATAINPTGAASDPDRDNDTGCWLFDGATTTEQLLFICQIPHSVALRFPLVPHVHWHKTSTASGNVRWIFNYKWWPLGAVLDTNWTTLTSSTPVAGTPDNNLVKEHLLTSFGNLDASSKEISDVLLIRLDRNPTHTDDTYGADAGLIELDIHAKFDALGSELEYEREGDY